MRFTGSPTPSLLKPRRMQWGAGLCLLILLLSLSIGPASAELARERLRIVTAGGAEHLFEIEVARNPVEQAQGLMFRQELAPDAGMLFPFEQERRASFWMRNTFVSLDMIFVARDGRIVKIHRRAEPLSEVSIGSGEPVTGVLEILGGQADERGISEGDYVRHPHFGEPSG